jgi:hypothetical protein
MKYMISSFQLFFHFHLVIWPNFLKNLNRNFHFKFQKWKIPNLKIEKNQFFHFEFSWHISKFSNFNPNFKIVFFSFFHFLWPFFFKNQKQKFQFKFQNWFFSKIFISNFPYDINKFFLSPKLPNLLKECKNYIFTLTKNSLILHTTTWWYGLP